MLTSETTQSTTERPRFTVLDWIGLLLTLPGVLVLLTAPITITPPFREMYREFGAEALLPGFTRLVMTPWLPVVLASIPMALAVLSAMNRFPIGLRRLFGVMAFALVLIDSAVYVVGLYLPIWNLAGSISSG